MAEILLSLQKEYSKAYFLKKFTTPKIFPKIVTSGQHFSESDKEAILEKYKKWYVYYKYVNPETGVMEQQTPIYFKINRTYPDFDDRLKHIKLLRDAVEKLLKRGFSPYEKKPEDQANGQEVTVEKSRTNKKSNSSVREKIITAERALDKGLEISQDEVEQTTYDSYRVRVNQLKEYLKKKKLLKTSIENIDKQVISDFLKTFKTNNRNNVKNALSPIFTILSSENMIAVNFVKEIRNKKKVQQEPVRIYTKEEVDHLTKLLALHDPKLLMYVKLVAYMFWRPIEIVRIHKDDIDFEGRVIRYIKTKGKPFKTKIIPDILYDDLKAFCEDKKDYLFKPDNSEDEPWTLKDTAKRGYFTLRFRRFRKKHNVSKEFKIYSFRHTYITKIYLELRKMKSKEQTIGILSLITGHESDAIHNYIMVNDLELPEDYSDMIKE